MGGDLQAVLVSAESDAAIRIAQALERAADGLSVTAADASTVGLDLVAADCLVVDADHPPSALLSDVARTPGVNDLPVVFVPDVSTDSRATGEAGAAATDCDAAYARVADRVGRSAERERRTGDGHRRNELLEEFASVVSHDLRSPLTVARGRLDLAASECDSEHLEHVSTALDRMSELIEDVLGLARAESEPRRRDPVSLPEVTSAAWRTSGAGRGTLTVADGLSFVEGDEARLRQLFENLFRNSVEHGSTGNWTQSGGSVEPCCTSGRAKSGESVEHGSTGNRTRSGDGAERVSGDVRPDGDASGPNAGVRVRVGPLPDGDGFYVADDGEGVPPSDRDRVFDPGVTTAPDGTGFGLAIVRRVAASHGWDVSLTESERGGVRFEFAGVRRVDPE